MVVASDKKPEIEFPDGPAPAELVIEDVVVGDGAEAVPGGTVKVHYVGVEYDTGDEFDSSWNRGESIEFPSARPDPGLAGRHPRHARWRAAQAGHPAGAGLRRRGVRAPAVG